MSVKQDENGILVKLLPLVTIGGNRIQNHSQQCILILPRMMQAIQVKLLWWMILHSFIMIQLHINRKQYKI